MPLLKNVASQRIPVFAYNITTGAAVINDQANITAQISLDGGATAATNDVNPTQLDATDAPGIYLFDTTQAETNGDLVVLYAVSATSNVVLDPITIYTFNPIASIADLLNEATGSYTTSNTVGDNIRQLHTKAITFPDIDGGLTNAAGQDANYYSVNVRLTRGATTDTYWLDFLKNGLPITGANIFAPGGGAGTPVLTVREADASGDLAVNAQVTSRSGPSSTGDAFFYISATQLPSGVAGQAFVTAYIDGADRPLRALAL